MRHQIKPSLANKIALSHIRRQAIILTNAVLLSVGPLGKKSVKQY